MHITQETRVPSQATNRAMRHSIRISNINRRVVVKDCLEDKDKDKDKEKDLDLRSEDEHKDSNFKC